MFGDNKAGLHKLVCFPGEQLHFACVSSKTLLFSSSPNFCFSPFLFFFFPDVFQHGIWNEVANFKHLDLRILSSG